MTESETHAEPASPKFENAAPVPPAAPAASWRERLPVWSLWLSLAVLAWFALAVFGPKFGLIGWKTGLVFMIREVGLYLLGLAALVAIVALALAFFARPRRAWWKAALALAIPTVLFMGLLSLQSQAAAVPPIHDVSTDLRDPPAFSPATMALREGLEANPLNDYGTPLGQLEAWKDASDPAIKVKNHADLISENYPELAPIVIGKASEQQAFDAIVAAMGEIGLKDVRRIEGSNTVEGTAETFAFGFKDDVVARVADGQIDLRSVSRVGVSDLGYNAARVKELSAAIRKRLGA